MALAETHCPLLHTRALFQTTKVVNISNGMKITFLSSFLAKHCMPTLSSRRYESLLIIQLALRSKVMSTTEKKKKEPLKDAEDILSPPPQRNLQKCQLYHHNITLVSREQDLYG